MEPSERQSDSLTPCLDAPQHGPRPLPLFLDIAVRETAGQPERFRALLDGLAVYQRAPRDPPPSPLPVIARSGRVSLLDYRGDGGTSGPPTIFVPSLINPPSILDLAQHNSLLRWLAANGVRPLLVDWGSPGPADRDQSIGDHVMDGLVPLIDAVGDEAHLAGYCLGGTMALAAAVHRPPLSLTMIAAPWRFEGFPPDARAGMAILWARVRPVAEQLGLLPMESLQSAFWMLDPARTVAKYEAFGRLDPASPAARAFVRMEDWANGGAPLTLAAGRELVEDLFTADASGRGAWRVGDRRIDPGALDCPVLDIVSTVDRIVPAATAAGVGTVRQLSLGHVGMIASHRAPDALWKPLAEWLSRVRRS